MIVWWIESNGSFSICKVIAWEILNKGKLLVMPQFNVLKFTWHLFDISEYGNPVIRSKGYCFQHARFLSSPHFPSHLSSPPLLLSFHFFFVPFLPFTFVAFPYPMGQLVFELKEKVDPFLRFSVFNNLSDKWQLNLKIASFRKLSLDASTPHW